MDEMVVYHGADIEEAPAACLQTKVRKFWTYRNHYMHIFEHIRAKLVDDFLRVCKILPSRLRRQTFGVFFCIAVLACLEVLSILSISFLALSVASPEKLSEFGIVARVFHLLPSLAVVCADPRYFALVASTSVVVLVLAKNGMSALVSVGTAKLGENIALFAGKTIFRHYLHSPYVKHISGDSNKVYQALAWRSQLGALIINIMMVYTYAAIALEHFTLEIVHNHNF